MSEEKGRNTDAARIGKDLDERVQIIRAGEPAFPALLKEIPDCPKVLYCIGDPGLLKKRCVSVVGSRTTTAYGRNTAKRIASALAACGVTVVSGMAAGIDTCAHEGALEAGGSTAAVLGCGPDVCYPPSGASLKEVIGRRGLILSEYPPGTQPRSFYFPQRNRIISGLSEITVVVQARNRSGALITAELAAEQGREVFAVPGPIDSQYNLGTNKLIKDGAVPLISISEISQLTGVSPDPDKDLKERLSDTEMRVFRIISEHGEMSADEVGIAAGQRPGYVNPILSALEIKGFITSEAGKFFLANQIDTSYNRKM